MRSPHCHDHNWGQESLVTAELIVPSHCEGGNDSTSFMLHVAVIVNYIALVHPGIVPKSIVRYSGAVTHIDLFN